MNQSVADNVTARKAANELIELGITLAKETGLEPDKVRRFWHYVMETAAELIGDDVLCDRCKRPTATGGTVHLEESTSGPRLTDDDPFPFGKYKGQRCSAVPDDYLKWFLRQEWCEEWPSVVEYAECL